MRHVLIIALVGLLAASASLIPGDAHAGTCKWGSIAIGCNGSCVEIYFQALVSGCTYTVDVQTRPCSGGSWTTVATNVTSPYQDCSGGGVDYRLVLNCPDCSITRITNPLGCTSCP